MATNKQFIEARDEMERILREETIGYLGLSLNGNPYVVPMNYGYVEGRIIIHCARKGKKLDYLRSNPQVCFSVGRQYGKVVRHPQGAPCNPDHESVICYGVARIVENPEERRDVLEVFNRCLQPGAQEITLEAATRCYAVEIKLFEMTGRQQRGLDHIYWRYSFSHQAE